MNKTLTIEDDQFTANKCLTNTYRSPNRLTGDRAGAFALNSTPPPAPPNPTARPISPEPVATLVAFAPGPDEAEQLQLNLRLDTISRPPQRLSELRRLLQKVIKSD